MLSIEGPDQEEALRLIYQLQPSADDQAQLGCSDPAGPVTSTISAMGLVASMLELLDVAPGDRVLEIGTGSGYNTALLAELVGDPSLVSSIDIDQGLIVDAAEHLAASGHSGAHLIWRDGHEGAAEQAPFHRIIATVGCGDLAPAWLDQLAPGGRSSFPSPTAGSTH